MYIYCSLQARENSTFKTRQIWNWGFGMLLSYSCKEINDILQWFRLKWCFLCHLAILKTPNHNKIDLIIIFIIPAEKMCIHQPTTTMLLVVLKNLFLNFIIFNFYFFTSFEYAKWCVKNSNGFRGSKKSKLKNQLQTFMSELNGYCSANKYVFLF